MTSIKCRDIISEHIYENFEDFFNEIIHYKGKHHNLITNNIFRGHSSENFELIPRILRKNDESVLLLDRIKIKKENNLKQERFESSLLRAFRHNSNFNSLNIPSYESIKGGKYWEYENFEAVAGLAQHYGLPTRLLDWTHEINTALYFAITGNKDENIFKEGNYLVIWVLDWFEATYLNEYTAIGKKILDNLSFITPDYHSNQNLGAQKGIFTFWKTDSSLDYIDRRPLNELIIEAGKNYYKEEESEYYDVDEMDDDDEIGVVMSKFMIHKKNIGEMYKYLTSINWKAAKLFPGFGGVVRELEENAYFRKHFK